MSQSTSNSILAELSCHFPQLKKKYSIKKIGLFGSFKKNQKRKKSDIDILVEFNRPSFDGYMDLKFFLEKLFKRNVDLVISSALKPRLRPVILKEVQFVKRS